jgi:hypothetical protein
MKKKSIFALIVACMSCVQIFAQKQDTLYTKRVFLTTYIYKDSVKFSKKEVSNLFKDTWQPRKKYKWSNILKPAGPVVAVGGAGLTFVACRGVNFITNTEVNYKVISLPQLSTGVGLFVLGLSMMAHSNQLSRQSVDVYNLMLKESKKTSYIDKIKFGLTESNYIGFSMSIK